MPVFTFDFGDQSHLQSDIQHFEVFLSFLDVNDAVRIRVYCFGELTLKSIALGFRF